MGFFVFFFIWYQVFGKQNIKIYRAIEGKIAKIFFWVILFSIITSFLPVISTLAIMLFFLAIFMSPFFLLGWIFSKAFGKKNTKRRGKQYSTAKPPVELSKSVPKRKKIVKKFSEKNNLNLTEKEIDRIVDASYLSYFWEREIYEMGLDYDSIYEWYNKDTGWLRAYFRVFPVQSVSSDYDRQKEICLDVYEQIFQEIDVMQYANIDECIDAINNRYMTAFDETTFMIAYRFLQKNGKKHKLPTQGIVRTESELERLMSKYDEETQWEDEEQKYKQKVRV